MSLRWQIALAMAAISVMATAVIGVVSYTQTRGRLLAEVDASLIALDQQIATRRIDLSALPDRGPFAGVYFRVIDADGSILRSTFPDEPDVEIDQPANRRGISISVFETVEADDETYRIRSVRSGGEIVQLGRSLDETDRVLRSVGLRILLWVVVVALMAVAAGLWIAGRVTRSLRRLTVAAEHVEATGRLDVEVSDDATDEVGRLGSAFDRMLAALRRSRDDQQRLVQDAGHELRTPLTSLRTNLDTLRRYPDLDGAQRSEIVDDLHAETEELTHLVNEIVAVATGDDTDEPETAFDLAEMVVELTERYERRSGREIAVTSESGSVVARRSQVQRAVSCLLDNARKFDTSGGPIDVDVRGRTVRVADRGPGIDPADREAIFERFHRAEQARTMPGSGLGLSIVRDVARRHGGETFAEGRPGGGAVVGFRLGAD